MDNVNDILEKLLKKELCVEEAGKLLKANFIEEVGELAKLDVFRKTRTGVPEVILAQNKEYSILAKIVDSFLKNKKFAIVSRYLEDQKSRLLEVYRIDNKYDVHINELAKILVIKEKSFGFQKKGGLVGIITAGSSDITVAEEAKEILLVMGCEVITSYDIGIAGMHRIFNPLKEMVERDVNVIIVCAGMEGTLPGVVAALVDIPVIGVPISSGYGMGANGKGALITMLQSCSPGLLVVNIDNGFGAGASAALIANKIAR
ncbi:MAG: nickel pincer cofactor biosynthesis protein LarB [Candidatus Lokiarchaeota archaeon]|nr:nickel pincer cofactor biosynthesis protein LarB [Candidatus Lokiarchaeota archaeon]